VEIEEDPRRSDATEAGQLDQAATERILAAATRVLAVEGPARTTLKWVAREAGVATEDLAAQWPTVSDLLGAVLDRLSAQIEGEAPNPNLPDTSPTPLDPHLVDLVGQFTEIVARSLLDGLNPAELQSQFPMLDRLVKFGMDLGVDERTARYRVCQFYVLEWGWRLFGPHLLVACGLSDEPEGRPVQELRVVERNLASLPPVEPL
jgi:AcrR family transcriptional regulator